MTLDEFRATGRDVADLHGAGCETGTDHSPAGRVYHGGLHLERMADGEFLLILGNAEYSAPLEKLESLLFAWGEVEGFFE